MRVIKNQGRCGSCWAFSTVGSLESNTEIQIGTYISLSEQELVSCDTQSYGCQGGYFTLAMNYETYNGAESEVEYPYKAANTPCQYNAKEVVNNHANGYTSI